MSSLRPTSEFVKFNVCEQSLLAMHEVRWVARTNVEYSAVRDILSLPDTLLIPRISTRT